MKKFNFFNFLVLLLICKLSFASFGGIFNFSKNKLSSVSAEESLQISPTTLPVAILNKTYSQTLVASGGIAPYVYEITSGSLPPTFSLNATTGVITGTPTTENTYLFTVTVTDSNGMKGSKAYSLVVSGPLPISPTTLSSAILNTNYNQTVTASGGITPYTYAITNGTLPPGLSLNSATGAISGIPKVIDTYFFTITATDATGTTGSRRYSLIVSGSLFISPTGLDKATLNTEYSQTLVASGGVAPYTYAVTAGTLPPGLSLDSASGAISGTPTVIDTYSFTITATDKNNVTGSQGYSLIVSGSLFISPTGLDKATLNTEYSQTLVASGGVAPYTYAVTAGTLPPGLSLDSASGAISGTPTVIDTYSFTITATDKNNVTGSQGYSLIVSGSLFISPTSLDKATLNTEYSQTLVASGGVAPYTYAVTEGSLPPGLSLDSSTGVISGKPTVIDTYSFTVTATDKQHTKGTQGYSLVVSGSLSISPTTIPGTTMNTAYTQTLSAKGGVGPYTYTITAGSLAPGLSLNSSTGVISGAASVEDTYSFTVTATDTKNTTGTQGYTLMVGGGKPKLTSFSTTAGVPSATGISLNTIWIGTSPAYDIASSETSNVNCVASIGTYRGNLDLYFGTGGQTNTAWNPGNTGEGQGASMVGHCVRLCTSFAVSATCTNWLYNAGN